MTFERSHFLGFTESVIEDSTYEGHIVKLRKSCVKGGEPSALILGSVRGALSAPRMLLGIRAGNSPALEVLMLLEVVPLRFLSARCNKEAAPFKRHSPPQAYLLHCANRLPRLLLHTAVHECCSTNGKTDGVK